MGFSLSGGPFQYNRFDAYDKRLGLDEKKSSSYMEKQEKEEEEYEDEESDKGASSPAKMAKDVKDEAKKSKKSSDKDEKESEDEEKEEEKDSLEEADMTGAPSIKNAKPATKTNVKFDKHMGLHAPTIRTVEGVESENMARRAMNKAPNSTKEKVQAKVMENHQMDSYVRALGKMGATYDIHEKKESTAERKSAADRGYEEKRQKKEGRYGEAHETGEIEKLQDKNLSKEQVEITKDVVLEYLVNEDYASNAVSAEAMFNHMSDGFLVSIENRISESAE